MPRSWNAAVASGARIIGVNNRNLHTFEVNLETSLRLAEQIPAGVLKVAESGIHSSHDIQRLARGRLRRVPGGRASDEIGRSRRSPAGFVVMMVKICGITNREDALAAVEAGASAIGFNFYRDSPRYISHTGAAMIAEKIPAQVWKVGIFVNENAGDHRPLRRWMPASTSLNCTAPVRSARYPRLASLPHHGSLIGSLPGRRFVEALLVDSPSEELLSVAPAKLSIGRAPGPCQEDRDRGRSGCRERAHRPSNRRSPGAWTPARRIEKSPGLKDHEKMKQFVKAALGL